jgi:hypothetical protein
MGNNLLQAYLYPAEHLAGINYLMSARGGQFTFYNIHWFERNLRNHHLCKTLDKQNPLLPPLLFQPTTGNTQTKHCYWHISRIKQNTADPETIDELIDTNPKCLLFFKIDLQEYFAVLICLSADKICQPFSWGGNFYVDSGSWVTSSQVQARIFSSVGHCVRKVKYI